MIYITKACVGCGICLEICPSEAIIENDEWFIDLEECTECRACITACPIDAISEK